MTTLSSLDADLIDATAALAGGYLGYKWLSVLIPGIGGIWGFAVGAVIFGGLMMAVLGTATGKKWGENVKIALGDIGRSPLLAITNYITALILFDTAWDYAFEFFDPVFDVIFEVIPGGFELWPLLNPYGGGFLGASAIIAALLTIGWYSLIQWPQSCALWMVCQLIGGGDIGQCGDPKHTGFPCPGGFFDYPCPNTMPQFNMAKDTYSLWALPGDLLHIGLIPVAMPLCLALQYFRGVCEGKGKKHLKFLDFMLYPYDVLNEFVTSIGTLFLDIGAIHGNTHWHDIFHIFDHLVDSVKCKSFGMNYCGRQT